MKILRQSSEDEMISEYLKAEYSSSRFSENIQEAMQKLSISENIILSPDLQNISENMQRRELLGVFRGYGLNQSMFERFPNVTDWFLCSFSKEDLGKIRYIDYSYWNELSEGTKLPINAVRTIHEGISVYGQSNEGFINAASYIRNGGVFNKMFFLTGDFENYVIVEGHMRMTAYAIEPDFFSNIEVIVGKCASNELEKWM